LLSDEDSPGPHETDALRDRQTVPSIRVLEVHGSNTGLIAPENGAEMSALNA